MFKKATIEYIEHRKKGDPAWRVSIDHKEPIDIIDLASVYAYLCGYPLVDRIPLKNREKSLEILIYE